MIEMNEEAFNDFNEKILVPCRFCNRTFLPDSLKIHQKRCTAEHPFKPLNRGGATKQPIKKVSQNDREDKPIGGKSGGMSRYQKPEPKKRPGVGLYSNNKKPNKREPVNNNRGYYEDSEQENDGSVEIKNNYSYSRPKRGAGPMNYKKKETEKPKRAYKPINSRQKSDRETELERLLPKIRPGIGERKKPGTQQRSFKPVAKPRSKAKAKPRSKPKTPEYEPIEYDFHGPPANLEPCRICGRTFNSDRIKKHQAACKISSKKPRKVKRFHKVMTKKEKMKILKNKPVPKWKAQHEEFVKQMQYNRKLMKVEAEGGNIRDLAPPPVSSQPGLVPCKFCGRKFREQAHARHEGICKSVFGGTKNKGPIKRPTQKRRRY